MADLQKQSTTSKESNLIARVSQDSNFLRISFNNRGNADDSIISRNSFFPRDDLSNNTLLIEQIEEIEFIPP